MPYANSSGWMLLLLDDEHRVGDADLSKIRGVLPPDDLQEAGERGVYARINVPGRARPLIQWVRNEQDEISFSATFVNDGSVVIGEGQAKGHAQRQRAILRKAARPIYALARPPRFYFIYGANLIAVVHVREVSAIRHSIALDTDDNPIMVWMDVTLEVLDEDLASRGADYVVPDDVINVKPPRPEATIQVKAGDTWEKITLREYGDATLGVAAMQKSKVAFPGSLTDAERTERVVELAERHLLSRAGVRPRSVALQLSRGDVNGAFNEVYTTRLKAPSILGVPTPEITPFA